MLRRSLSCAVALTCVACIYPMDTSLESLSPGDVRARVRVDAGGGAEPREGAVGTLRGMPLQRRSDATGRLLLRNVASGNHLLVVSLDGDGDGVPELGRQVPFRLKERNGERGSVDLGNVDLGRVGVLRGKVRVETNGVCPESALPPAGTVVALDLEDRFVAVDAAGNFTMEGVLPGTHEAMAAAPGALSQKEPFVVGDGADHTLAQVLCLRGAAAAVTEPVRGQLVPAPGQEGAQFPTVIPVNLVPLTGAPPASGQQAQGRYEFGGIAPSIYAMEANAGEDYLPVRLAWVFVPQQGRDLGNTFVYLREDDDPPPASSSSSATSESRSSSAPSSSSAPASSSASASSVSASSSVGTVSPSSGGADSSSVTGTDSSGGTLLSSSSALASSAASASSAPVGPSSADSGPSSNAAAPSSMGSASSAPVGPSSADSGPSSSAAVPSSMGSASSDSASSAVASSGTASSAAPSSSAMPLGPRLVLTQTPSSAVARTRLTVGDAQVVQAWTLSVPAGVEPVALASVHLALPPGVSSRVELWEDLGTPGERDAADVSLGQQAAATGVVVLMAGAGLTVSAGNPVRLLVTQAASAMNAVECRAEAEPPYVTSTGTVSLTVASVDVSGLAVLPPMACVVPTITVTEFLLPRAPLDVPETSTNQVLLRLRVSSDAPDALTVTLGPYGLVRNQGNAAGTVSLVRDVNADGRHTAADLEVAGDPYDLTAQASFVVPAHAFSVRGQEDFVISASIVGGGSSFYFLNEAAAAIPISCPLAQVNAPGAYRPRSISTFSMTLSHARAPLVLPNATFQDATLADINDDGLDDVVLLESNGNVSALRGTDLYAQEGTPTAIKAVGRPALFVRVADIDLDSVKDLVVVTAADVRVFRGTSAGMFEPSPRVTLSSGTPSSVALGDVLRNGFVDVVLAIPAPGLVEVLPNASGLLGASTTNTRVTGMAGVAGLRVADMDVDGDLDLVFRAGMRLNIYENTPTGFSSLAGASGTATDTRSDSLVADFSRDGRPDVLDLGSGSANALLLSGTAVPATYSTFSIPRSAPPWPVSAVFDLGSDALLDAVGVRDPAFGPAVLTVWPGDASTGLSSVVTNKPLLGDDPAALLPVDHNRDGDLDVFVVTRSPTGSRLEYMEAEGVRPGGVRDAAGMGVVAASQPVSSATSAQGSVLLADFNRDGRLDVLRTVNTPARLQVLLVGGTDASPTWTLSTDQALPGPAVTALADFNQDGAVDVVVASSSASEVLVQVWRNDSANGVLSNASTRTLAGSTQAVAVAVADLFRDGFPDVVVAASPSPSTVAVFQNVSGGLLGVPTLTALSDPPVGMVLTDVRGASGVRDGMPDVVLLSASGLSVATINAAGAVQTPVAQSVVFTGALALATEDISRDAFPDLVVVQEDGSVVGLRGQRTGPDAFSLASTERCAAVLATQASVVLADTDRDADLDVVVSLAGTGLCILGNVHPARLRLAAPTAASGTLRSGPRGAVAAGDMNRDGDLDVVASFTTGTFVFRGQ